MDFPLTDHAPGSGSDGGVGGVGALAEIRTRITSRSQVPKTCVSAIPPREQKMVLVTRLELVRPYEQSILSRSRLPFRQTRMFFNKLSVARSERTGKMVGAPQQNRTASPCLEGTYAATTPAERKELVGATRFERATASPPD